ncbi:MAG: glycoside hydrolase family 43 protein, partial [Verrucomicrobiota bacterium]
MPLRDEIKIRDPFILPLKEEGKYYLYGTTDKHPWSGSPGVGFNTYTSEDLADWDGPFEVFTPPEGFWGKYNFWAPEVHLHKGRYYMFASFKADGVSRGTQILVADSPLGPFVPHSDGPVTPKEWWCLDGTLFVDDAGDPWMVFCYEWTQVNDGQMCAVKLTPELDAEVGEPGLLFTASEARWSVPLPDKDHDCFVTDGPYLYRAKNGELLMLWSTHGKDGYAMGVARSSSGKLFGPWAQEPEPLYPKDGGHGMFFRTFDGQLMVTLHYPNDEPNERPFFLPV